MKSRGLSIWLCVLWLSFGASVPGVSAQQSVDATQPVQGNDCRALVTIEGAVLSPGRFELRRRVRLRELIARAGGATEAATGTVEILHTITASALQIPAPKTSWQLGPEKIFDRYKLSDLRESADEMANPYLRAGDFVSVQTADPVNVVGYVKPPRVHYLGESLPLTRVLEMAGGVLESPFTGRIAIYRPHGFDMRQIIYADLHQIKRGHDQDIPLRPYDIVKVKDKRREHSGPTIYLTPELFGNKEKQPQPRIIY